MFKLFKRSKSDKIEDLDFIKLNLRKNIHEELTKFGNKEPFLSEATNLLEGNIELVLEKMEFFIKNEEDINSVSDKLVSEFKKEVNQWYLDGNCSYQYAQNIFIYFGEVIHRLRNNNVHPYLTALSNSMMKVGNMLR